MLDDNSKVVILLSKAFRTPTAVLSCALGWARQRWPRPHYTLVFELILVSRYCVM